MRGKRFARKALATVGLRFPIFSGREESVLHVDHPQLAPFAALVDQPHAAGVALALLDDALRQGAEKLIEIWLTDEQIESELDDFGLHVRAAFGAPAFVGFATQRRAQDVRISRRQFFRRLPAHARGIASRLVHRVPLSNYPAVCALSG